MSPTLGQQVVGSHVRRLRAESGISLRLLANRTGFSASFISQLENGQVSPSISSLERIAEALGVTLSEFFTTAGDPVAPIVREADRQELESGWSRARIEALGSGSKRLESFLVTLEPGGRSGKRPHPHSAEEFVFVVSGQLVLTLGDEAHTLRSRDAVTIRAKQPRMWENKSSKPAQILIVSSRLPG